MKCYLIIALIAFTGLTASAQTRYKTDERMIDQFKNGTVPGLLFSKSVPAQKAPEAKPANTESFGRQIRNNAIPGVLYKETMTPAQPATGQNVQARPDTSSAGTRAGVNQKVPQKSPFKTTTD
ncbi:hypothetical protein SAMN05216327_102293 [Dyadobacter sp. SG02]|uniref:hypothetical protein n=1 Tax=Dyadobacter sp. SG02 TaxID=1855291 RepID=UPI0008D6831E|nr:hypothetical protein [Dyadobacter sp. SG02]SEI53465.1 hypothetical protein SAMN05216327_102293 [Dyadobacter sp. SG02]